MTEAANDAAPKFRFVTAEEFARKKDDSAEALLGTEDEAIVTAGSTVLTYGDAGAGKTTLELDAAFHLSDGVDWLGFTVNRELRIAVIENEGPRGPFRRKVGQKLHSWGGPQPDGLFFLEEPWARLDLSKDAQVEVLRAWIDENEIDLLMLGPVASVGFAGAGTPDDITAHEERLALLRKDLNKPLAVWLVHHENKAGDVSGAWERLPDTLVHVRASEGGGCTLLTWRKTRWSSSTHNTKMTLRWTDAEGFEVLDADARAAQRQADLDEARNWIAAYVTKNPGEPRSVVETAYADGRPKGARARARATIDDALRPNENGEHSWLATSPGRAANGVYLYPASGASSPLAINLNGEHGEHPSNLEERECSPLAAPYKGEADGGEQRARSETEVAEDLLEGHDDIASGVAR